MNHTTTAIAVSRCGIVLLFGGLAAACIDQGTPLEENTLGSNPSTESLSSSVIRVPLPGETHFANLKQLTFEGENAEAYFSSDGEQLIFQRRHQGEYDCDQIFTISVAGGQPTLGHHCTAKERCEFTNVWRKPVLKSGKVCCFFSIVWSFRDKLYISPPPPGGGRTTATRKFQPALGHDCLRCWYTG